MPEWASKILKHNPGEKSLKVRFVFFLDLECVLEKLQSTQSLLVGRYIQNLHMIKKKIGLITTEEKIVLKNYVKS